MDRLQIAAILLIWLMSIGLANAGTAVLGTQVKVVSGTCGLRLNPGSIDWGQVTPGASSWGEGVMVNNVGTMPTGVLISGSNMTGAGSSKINVGNVGYSTFFSMSYKPVSSSPVLISSSLMSGGFLITYLQLTVPCGTVTGIYKGQIIFTSSC